MPESTYAVVKCGGKQYRVEEGTTLLVDRMTATRAPPSTSSRCSTRAARTPLFPGSDLGRIKVKAKIVGHERGPKLRVFKFKPKRGYKRTTGHRSELTRIEVTGISVGKGSSSSKKKTEEAEDGS